MDNYSRLDKLSKKKDSDRHKSLEKRVNDIKNVITDPDVWNVNIASRERIEELERRVEELERKLAAILKNPPK